MKQLLFGIACLLVLRVNTFAQTYTVTTAAESGAGSIREALTLVNAGSINRIIFNISPGSSAADSITLTSNLPVIQRAVTIDATTESGYVKGAPVVVLKWGGPSVVGQTYYGLKDSTSITTPFIVQGLGIAKFNQQGATIGIYINFNRDQSAGTIVKQISDCFFYNNGTAFLGGCVRVKDCIVDRALMDGIDVWDNSIIEGCIVKNIGRIGIGLSGQDNLVQNNQLDKYVDPSIADDPAVGFSGAIFVGYGSWGGNKIIKNRVTNSTIGIQIFSMVSADQGLNIVEENSVLNCDNGILISRNTTRTNILNNTIKGSSRVGLRCEKGILQCFFNGNRITECGNGIQFGFGSYSNIFKGNKIYANTKNGIAIRGTGITNNYFTENYIWDNDSCGINQVGNTNTRNLFRKNQIGIDTLGNVRGNLIGVLAKYQAFIGSLDSGNVIKGSGLAGIMLTNTANGSQIVGNIVAQNGGNGIDIAGNGNTVYANTIGLASQGNAGIGLLLTGNGNIAASEVYPNTYTANGGDAIHISGQGNRAAYGVMNTKAGFKAVNLNGGNSGKQAPTLDSYTVANDNIILSGTCQDGDTIYIYQSDGKSQVAVKYLSKVVASGTTWGQAIPINSLESGFDYAYFIAQGDDGFRSSELGNVLKTLCFTCECVVTNVNESGPGSLRAAVECANNTIGLTTIQFNIPANLMTGGKWEISLDSALIIKEALIMDGPVNGAGKPLVKLISRNANDVSAVSQLINLPNTNGSVIRHLEIVSTPNGHTGAIGGYVDKDSTITENNIISGFKMGINFTIIGTTATLKVKNNSISAVTDRGILITGGKPVVSGNTITGAGTSNWAAIHLFTSRDAVVEQNIISDFASGIVSANSSGGNIFKGNIIGLCNEGFTTYDDFGNTFIGNYIGTDAQGANNAIRQNGISFRGGFGSVGNGTLAGQNIINAQINGVSLRDCNVNRVEINGNVLYGHLGKAIDLPSCGANSANFNKKAPVLVSQNFTGDSIVLMVQTELTDTRVEVYKTTNGTDATQFIPSPVLKKSGVQWRVSFPWTTGADKFVVTSTGPTQNTSQLSVPPSICLVTTTADSGPGSLREAINSANAGTCSFIQFNISSTSGIDTIRVLSDLPAITATVTIDGTTESGYQKGQMPRIHILNSGANMGIFFQGAGSIVKGLTFDGFASILSFAAGNIFENDVFLNSPIATQMSMSQGSSIVKGCHFGITTDGILQKTALTAGIGINGDNYIIGTADAPNVIAGNGYVGINVNGQNNSILYNSIYKNGITYGPNQAILLGPGANNSIVKPIISSHTGAGTSITITGMAVANGVVQIFTGSYKGEDALAYVGQAQVDGAGNWNFAIPANFISLTTNNYFVATVTDNVGNTSQLSFTYRIGNFPESCIVTNTNTSGPGSFTAALDCANSLPVHAIIDFQIPGAGPKVIEYTQYTDLWQYRFANPNGITVDGKTDNITIRNTFKPSEPISLGFSANYPAFYWSQIGKKNVLRNITLDGIGVSARTTDSCLITRTTIINTPYPIFFDEGCRANTITDNVLGNAIAAISFRVTGVNDYNFRNTRIEGNYIGLNRNGDSLGLSKYGIYFAGKPDQPMTGIVIGNNIIGYLHPTKPAEFGDRFAGIYMAINHAIVKNNSIGEWNGKKTPIRGIGIFETGGGNNYIDNIIANADTGVIAQSRQFFTLEKNVWKRTVFKNTTTDIFQINSVLQNTISQSRIDVVKPNQKGIRLVNAGNNFKAAPSVTGAGNPSSIILKGVALPNDKIEIYTTNATGDANIVFIDSVFAGTDGRWTKTLTTPIISPATENHFIATATDPDGNTSEFSTVFTICPACLCIVTNTNDAGAGSLRAAVECANLKSTHTNIVFAIPGAGPYTIDLQSPIVAGVATGFTLDGLSQISSATGTGADQRIIIQKQSLIFTSDEGPTDIKNLNFIGQPMATLIQADSISVDKCTFTGNGNAVIVQMPNDTLADNISITNNTYTNCNTSVIAQNATGVVIKGNKVTSTTTGNNFNLSSCNHADISNNIIDASNVGTAIQITSSSQVAISRNKITGVQYGISFGVLKKSTIADNLIRNVSYGMTFPGGMSSETILIKNDTIRKASVLGIFASLSNNSSISNCILDTVGVGMSFPTNQGGFFNSTIIRNTVTHFTTGGIDLAQTDGCVIKENTIGFGTGYGIGTMRNAVNSIIRNNFIGISPQLAKMPITGAGINLSYMWGASGVTIEGNHIGNISASGPVTSLNGTALYMYAGSALNVQLRKNFLGIDSTGGTHSVERSGIALTSVVDLEKDVFITGNRIANARFGIELYRGRTVTIASNDIRNVTNAVDIRDAFSVNNRVTLGTYTNVLNKRINLHYGVTDTVANNAKSVPFVRGFARQSTNVVLKGMSASGDTVEVFQGTGTNPKIYRYVGTGITNQLGEWQVTAPATTVSLTGESVFTATATDVTGNTSEFGNELPICVGCICEVTNANDAGTGSLREAIICANGKGSGTTIVFKISPASVDVDTIRITSAPLPAITAGILVDGTTETGYDITKTPRVYIKAQLSNNLYGLSVEFPAYSAVIRGIALSKFRYGLNVGGVDTEIDDCAIINSVQEGAVNITGKNPVLAGNYIGITPEGKPEGSAGMGIFVSGSSENVTIGTQAKPNIIAYNNDGGVAFNGPAAVVYNSIYANGNPASAKAIYSSAPPVATVTELGTNSWQVSGTTNANARVQFFLNDGNKEQAIRFIGEVFADGAGNWTYPVPAAYNPVTKNTYFVYTTTSGLPNRLSTSALSRPVRIGNFPTVCTVTNINDSGDGSLRAAIGCVNDADNKAIVAFLLPTNSNDPTDPVVANRTITITSQPLTITNNYGVTINGGINRVKVQTTQAFPIFVAASYNNFSNLDLQGGFNAIIGGNNNVIDSCEFTGTSNYALMLNSSNSSVKNSYFYGSTSSAGIYLAGTGSTINKCYFGFNRKLADILTSNAIATTSASDVKITNNYFGNIGTTGQPANAITFNERGYGNTITNNTFGEFNGRSTPIYGTAMSLGGGWGSGTGIAHKRAFVVEKNVIKNVTNGVFTAAPNTLIQSNLFSSITNSAIDELSIYTSIVGLPVAIHSKNIILGTPVGKAAISSPVNKPAITGFELQDKNFVTIKGTADNNGYVELFKGAQSGQIAAAYWANVKADGAGNWTIVMPLDSFNIDGINYLTATNMNIDSLSSALMDNYSLPLHICLVTNVNNAGANTLRECITRANNNEYNYIRFNIDADAAPNEIILQSALPAIVVDGLNINGLSEPGAEAWLAPEIVVKGSQTIATGFAVQAKSNTYMKNIRVTGFATGIDLVTTVNTTIKAFVIDAYKDKGINLSGANSAKANLLQNRLDGAGTGGYGIYSQASDVKVEYARAIQNAKAGMYLKGNNYDIVNSRFANNHPGTTDEALTGGIVAEQSTGLLIKLDTLIGNGTGARLVNCTTDSLRSNMFYQGSGNTVTGNDLASISLSGSSKIYVWQNYIRGAATGISLLNSSENVLLSNDLRANTTGGAIALQGSSKNELSYNVIMSNLGDAVVMRASSSENILRNNLIGCADTTLFSTTGNGGAGVRIGGSLKNIITNNTIAQNAGGGVVLMSGTNNKIYKNRISRNGTYPAQLAISLNQGAANLNKKVPGIDSIIPSGKAYLIKGTSEVGDSVHIYTNRGFYQEAFKQIATAKADPATGKWAVSIDTVWLFNNFYSAYLVATATDAANNTSELSPMFALGYCMVTTQSDNGNNQVPIEGSLRMAVGCLNDSRIKGRLMVSILEANRPAVVLTEELNPITNVFGVDLNGRNKIFQRPDNRLKVSLPSKTTSWLWQVSADVPNAAFHHFSNQHPQGMNAQAAKVLVDSVDFIDATKSSQVALWLNKKVKHAVIRYVTTDSYATGLLADVTPRLEVVTSVFRNSIVGASMIQGTDSISIRKSFFINNTAAGLVLDNAGHKKAFIEADSFALSPVGVVLRQSPGTVIQSGKFRNIRTSSSAVFTDSEGNSGIGVLVLGASNNVSVTGGNFRGIEKTGVKFDKSGTWAGTAYTNNYASSGYISGNSFTDTVTAIAVSGKYYQILNNSSAGRFQLVSLKQSYVKSNTLAGKYAQLNLVSSDSVTMRRNSVYGFPLTEKPINLNRGGSAVSNNGKAAPVFVGQFTKVISKRIKLVIVGKTAPFNTVELFKTDSLRLSRADSLTPTLRSYVDTVAADANGDWEYIVPVEQIPIEQSSFYVATATALDSTATSDASAVFRLPVFIQVVDVINTNNAGYGSLRNAVEYINITDPQVKVRFLIPGAGPYRIMLDSSLAAIKSVNGFKMDAFTQYTYPASTGDRTVIVDGSKVALIDSLKEVPAFDFKENPNKSVFRAVNVENFKNAFAFNAAGLKVASLYAANYNANIDKDDTTSIGFRFVADAANGISLDSCRAQGFSIGYALEEHIDKTEIKNSSADEVSVGFMLRRPKKVTVKKNTATRFKKAGIYWRQDGAEGQSVIQRNNIGYQKGSFTEMSEGSGIWLHNVSSQIIDTNYIGNLNQGYDDRVAGILLTGVAKKIIMRSNVIGADEDSVAYNLGAYGVHMQAHRGDTIVENTISGNVIGNTAMAGVRLDSSSFNILTGNYIGVLGPHVGSKGHAPLGAEGVSMVDVHDEQVLDNTILNYGTYGVDLIRSANVAINRSVTNTGEKMKKGINLNRVSADSSNGGQKVPQITTFDVLDADNVKISGTSAQNQTIELFKGKTNDSPQSRSYIGQVYTQNGNWNVNVSRKFFGFDSTAYFVATATSVSNMTSEYSAPFAAERLLCGLDPATVLRDTTKICPSAKIDLDLRIENLEYKWTRNDTLLANETGSILYKTNKPGMYKVEITDKTNCVKTAKTYLKHLPNPVKPEFLVASEVVAGDTVALIDVSDVPNADDIREWLQPEDAIIWQDKTTVAQGRIYYIIFPKPKTYEFYRKASRGICEEKINRSITVYDPGDVEALSRMSKNKVTEIVECVVYPNPTDSDFGVKVTLNNWSDIKVEIREMSSGQVVRTSAVSKRKEHIFHIPSTGLAAGVYLVSVEAGNRRQVLKAVLTRN